MCDIMSRLSQAPWTGPPEGSQTHSAPKSQSRNFVILPTADHRLISILPGSRAARERVGRSQSRLPPPQGPGQDEKKGPIVRRAGEKCRWKNHSIEPSFPG